MLESEISMYNSTHCILCGKQIFHGDKCIELNCGCYNGVYHEFHVHETKYACTCILKTNPKLKFEEV